MIRNCKTEIKIVVALLVKYSVKNNIKREPWSLEGESVSKSP